MDIRKGKVEPRLAVGDTVHAANPTIRHVIKAIDGEEAWLQSQSGDHYTMKIVLLHRAN